MYKRITSYFKKHVTYNSFVHVVGGMGIGVLIASPIVGIHPLRWGLGLIGLSLLGHLYAAVSEK